MVTDAYSKKLNEIVLDIEKVYGLDILSKKDVGLAHSDASEVIKSVSSKISGMQNEIIYEKNRDANRFIILLSYLSHRMKYYKKVRLDYSTYPCMDIVSKILLSFINKETVTKENVRQLNKVVQVLTEIDMKHAKYKFGLGYKFLRLFVILVLFKNYCGASIIATLILDQLVVSGGM